MSDLISRQAAMTIPVLPKEHRDYISFELDDIYEQGWNECQKFIAELPSEDRPQGEWIDMGDFEQCSVCEGTHLKEFETRYGKALWVKSKYCRNCGADMRGEQDEH